MRDGTLASEKEIWMRRLPPHKEENELMNDRILVKVFCSQELLDLRTISRTRKSPHTFSILRETLAHLEAERWLTVYSLDSSAILRLLEESGGQQILEMDITWLQDQGGGRVAGWKERLRLPYAPFQDFIRAEGEENCTAWKQLSIPEAKNRRVEFHSRERLQEVLRHPVLRHKLGKLLAQEFQWPGTEKIFLYDDFEPYSFFFREYTTRGPGICGGIILSRSGKLRDSHYSVHT